MDREVVEAFRRGEGPAFAALIRAWTPLVRRVVGRFFSGTFLQEEAVQEVWMQVFRQRESLDPGRREEFAGWLGTLARNRCVDLLRRTGRRVPEVAVADIEDVADEPPAEPDSEQAAALSELRLAVEAFRDRLPADQREFFILHFVQGLGYPEIALRLGLGAARCKYLKRVLIRRARGHAGLMAALGRCPRKGGDHAP